MLARTTFLRISCSLHTCNRISIASRHPHQRISAHRTALINGLRHRNCFYSGILDLLRNQERERRNGDDAGSNSTSADHAKTEHEDNVKEVDGEEEQFDERYKKTADDMGTSFGVHGPVVATTSTEALSDFDRPRTKGKALATADPGFLEPDEALEIDPPLWTDPDDGAAAKVSVEGSNTEGAPKQPEPLYQLSFEHYTPIERLPQSENEALSLSSSDTGMSIESQGYSGNQPALPPPSCFGLVAVLSLEELLNAIVMNVSDYIHPASVFSTWSSELFESIQDARRVQICADALTFLTFQPYIRSPLFAISPVSVFYIQYQQLRKMPPLMHQTIVTFLHGSFTRMLTQEAFTNRHTVSSFFHKRRKIICAPVAESVAQRGDATHRQTTGIAGSTTSLTDNGSPLREAETVKSVHIGAFENHWSSLDNHFSLRDRCIDRVRKAARLSRLSRKRRDNVIDVLHLGTVHLARVLERTHSISQKLSFIHDLLFAFKKLDIAVSKEYYTQESLEDKLHALAVFKQAHDQHILVQNVLKSLQYAVELLKGYDIPPDSYHANDLITTAVLSECKSVSSSATIAYTPDATTFPGVESSRSESALPTDNTSSSENTRSSDNTSSSPGTSHAQKKIASTDAPSENEKISSIGAPFTNDTSPVLDGSSTGATLGQPASQNIGLRSYIGTMELRIQKEVTQLCAGLPSSWTADQKLRRRDYHIHKIRSWQGKLKSLVRQLAIFDDRAEKQVKLPLETRGMHLSELHADTPAFLPYGTQHDMLRDILDDFKRAIYAFGNNLVPKFMEAKGWDCYQAVDVVEFEILCRSHNKPREELESLFVRASGLLNSRLGNHQTVFGRLRQCRNMYAHHLRDMSANDIKEMFTQLRILARELKGKALDKRLKHYVEVLSQYNDSYQRFRDDLRRKTQMQIGGLAQQKKEKLAELKRLDHEYAEALKKYGRREKQGAKACVSQLKIFPQLPSENLPGLAASKAHQFASADEVVDEQGTNVDKSEPQDLEDQALPATPTPDKMVPLMDKTAPAEETTPSRKFRGRKRRLWRRVALQRQLPSSSDAGEEIAPDEATRG
ncbi:hypothetical protein BDV95DRAFT_563443 [Massariosphaeria phaeospora]|uniref:Uncharacterized protein n=1 Tax=Massariosphaeria phaeospora TaxID=100035 RepID=A0A7C8MQM5_9PLEO|nr:hypothetical protein BDV95DRAFT_563443 [Massariosphaeria phaeospora]